MTKELAPTVQAVRAVADAAFSFCRDLQENYWLNDQVAPDGFPESLAIIKLVNSARDLERALNPRCLPFNQNGRRGLVVNGWLHDYKIQAGFAQLRTLHDRILTSWQIEAICEDKNLSITDPAGGERWPPKVERSVWEGLVQASTNLAEAFRVELAAAQTPVSAAPPRPAAEQNSVTRHSTDFRSVHWFGTDYAFSGTQAACIKVLWQAWENETPELGQDTILEHPEVEAEAKRLIDVFRKHPAWGTMIVSGSTKGSFRLNPAKK